MAFEPLPVPTNPTVCCGNSTPGLCHQEDRGPSPSSPISVAMALSWKRQLLAFLISPVPCCRSCVSGNHGELRVEAEKGLHGLPSTLDVRKAVYLVPCTHPGAIRARHGTPQRRSPNLTDSSKSSGSFTGPRVLNILLSKLLLASILL